MLKERLVYLRKKKKLSQYEVAEKLGFSRGKLANYEQGTRQPDYETLEKIADFYDVSLDYLLGRTERTSSANNEFNPMHEINHLLHKYGIEDSSFFDIEKWKAMGPDEIRELESYFEFIAEKDKKKNNNNK